MKILFATGRIRTVGGGAERSARTLISRLAKRHSLFVFNVQYDDSSAENPFAGENVEITDWPYNSVTVKNIRPHHRKLLHIDAVAEKTFLSYVEKVQPGLVIVQYPPMIYQRVRGLPHISFVRDLNYIRDYEHRSMVRKLYNLPFIAEKRRRMLQGLRNSDLVITNSRYMAEQLGLLGIDAEVVYPFIDSAQYSSTESSHDGPITFVAANLDRHKGIDIFMDIVRAMPGRRFRLAGRQVFPLDIPSNLEFIGWQKNIRQAMADSALVLVPSRWDEPFGRLPIEAGFMGIPVIASNRGGLPEAVGDGGILIKDPENIDEWVKTIDEVLSNPHIYNGLAKKSRANVERFAGQDPFDNFKSIVERKMGVLL